MGNEFDYNNAMASLYPDTEYIINKSAYDSGLEGVKEEIVRCKDCEHAFEKDNGMYSCHGDLTEPWDYYNDCPNVTLVPADGFCFCGKRREE